SLQVMKCPSRNSNSHASSILLGVRYPHLARCGAVSDEARRISTGRVEVGGQTRAFVGALGRGSTVPPARKAADAGSGPTARSAGMNDSTASDYTTPNRRAELRLRSTSDRTRRREFSATKTG